MPGKRCRGCLQRRFDHVFKKMNCQEGEAAAEAAAAAKRPGVRAMFVARYTASVGAYFEPTTLIYACIAWRPFANIAFKQLIDR